jgi:hypothetical protein
MRVLRLASAAAVAIMLVAAPILVSASDSDKDKTADKPTATVTTTESVPATRLATLKAVKAAPMSPGELDAVKGQHAHFWNPGAPFPGAPHVVNGNNLDNWLDLGNGEIVGPGYHGLCTANVKSSAIFINPGGGC